MTASRDRREMRTLEILLASGAVALGVVASSALLPVSSAAAADAPVGALANSPPQNNKPMKMDEPMRGEMKKEGAMKRDVKESKEKWERKMDDLMDKEEKAMPPGKAGK